jgi:dimethylargininase
VSETAAPQLIAVTHLPSPGIQQGERTFVGDEPIDAALALRQHEAYRDALRRCGADVVVLEANRACPDGVFVEDTAIVLDDLAVMMSMGAASRRSETAAIEAELSRWRPIARVRLPATIDGGDVVRAGRTLYIGRSPRTNDAGIAALRSIVSPFGYTVTAVSVTGCLHLKTACSALPDGQFLVNADWIDVSALPAGALVPVPRDEPWAGDVLVIGDRIIVSDAFPRTAALLGAASTEVIPVSVSEFAKAEGGVTCLSLVFAA